MAALVAQLAKAVIFRGLIPSQLELVVGISALQDFPRGSVIFTEGEPGEELYLIVKGKVQIAREWPMGGQETLAELGPGDAFGEMAILDEGLRRSATARAGEDCTLLVLKRKSFQDLLRQNHALSDAVLWNVIRQFSGRLRATNDKVMMFLSSSGLY